MKRAIIVDDEQAALDKLTKMLRETGRVEVKAAFLRAADAEEYVRKNQVDIAFLDIEMPGLGGLELADRLIDMHNGLNIIFVTAYSEYAVEAFRIHALDYLLKPVSSERLNAALDRVYKEHSTLPKDTSITVRCLGKFQVEIDGETVKFRTAKARELFAYFICSNDAPVSRNHIVDVFWEDYDGDRAVILFNTTLYYLKKAFLEKGVQLNISNDRGLYRLDMNNIDCDALRFTKIATSAPIISEENIGLYEATLGEYTGDYFEHDEYIWSIQKKVDMKEQFIRLVLAVCDYYQGKGRTVEEINTIQAALHSDPLNQHLNLRLLEVLRKRNDFVSMRRYYQLYQSRLEQEFGLRPGAEFFSMMKGI